MKKYILTISTVLFLGACKSDFLDRAPLTQYSNDSLWKTKADVTAALTGCYKGWESGGNILYFDCITDNGYDQFPWEGMELVASGNMSPLDTGVNGWDYKTIQRCNWFINNVDKAPISTDLPASLVTRMKSEARFLRAYSYFMLTQYYGDVPFVLNELIPAEANTIKQTPKAEVVQFVLSELAAISTSLPVSYTGSNIGRITSGAALGLKARVELYEGKWNECIATSQKLMAAPYSYALYSNYTELFRPMNAYNSEVMLTVERKKDNASEWVLIALGISSQGGWSSITPTQALVDAYETKNGKTITEDATYNPAKPYENRDPRLDASIIRAGLLYAGKYFNPYSGTDKMGENNASATGYNVKKYMSNPQDYKGTTYGVDIYQTGGSIIAMRYAEILLSYAEAKIEAGQIDASVYNAIDKLRTRAGMPNVDQSVYNNQAKLRELIRRERRVELAMEGLRWFDIKRWKISPQVMNGYVRSAPKTGSVNMTTGEVTLTPGTNENISERKFVDPKHYLLPIPQKEIDLNKNLKQNTGY